MSPVAVGASDHGPPALDRSRTFRAAVPEPSLAAGAAIACVAAGLLSLNRFGGLVTQAPRAFVRLALVVVWGWIGLGVTMWLLTTAFARRQARLDDLQRELARTGRAHTALVALAITMFVFAGALQLRWPGLLLTIAVVGWWFPRSLLAGATTQRSASTWARIMATVLAFSGWLVVIGRHLLVQLGHLI